jgi:dynein heavy chain
MEWKLKDFEFILFGSYENPKREYNMLSETEKLIPRLDTFLEMYNADNSPMNLVFFGDCIQHLSRIARVLSQQRGNAMLVGVGGSGRRSMARLGGSINEQTTFSIEITKSYREKEFHEDIRMLLRASGVDGQQ